MSAGRLAALAGALLLLPAVAHAQARRVYTNVDPATGLRTARPFAVTAPAPAPRAALAAETLAGLKAREWFWAPEWLSGPTSTVSYPGADWPLPRSARVPMTRSTGWAPLYAPYPVYGFGAPFIALPAPRPATRGGGRHGGR